MKRTSVIVIPLFLLINGLLLLFTAGYGTQPKTLHPLPRLVVVVSIDAFKAEYLEKFDDLYGTDGFKKLTRDGAWFSNTHHSHAVLSTGPGHANISTGCNPAKHGIVGNSWYEADKQRNMYCIGCSVSVAVNSNGKTDRPSNSPANMKVGTLGDALKIATNGKAKVWSLSMKARAAVLLGGKHPDGAVWWSTDTGEFETSNYYAEKLPDWCIRFNRSGAADRYFGKKWERVLPVEAYDRCDVDDAKYETGFKAGLSNVLPKTLGEGLEKPGKDYYNQLGCTPMGIELLMELAEAAIVAESLGVDDVPDILWLGPSSMDNATHFFGPHSHEILDMCVRMDQQLEELLRFLDEKIGLEHCIFVVTSDHGFGIPPESKLNLPGIGGRIDFKSLRRELNEKLCTKFQLGTNPPASFIESLGIPFVFVDEVSLNEAGVNINSALQWIAAQLRAKDGVENAVVCRTPEDIAAISDDKLRGCIEQNYYPGRSAQIYLHVKPLWMDDYECANHGTVHDYDTHVPMIFYGRAFKPGRYESRVDPVDLAVTLAKVLEMNALTNVDGRILTECLSYP